MPRNGTKLNELLGAKERIGSISRVLATSLSQCKDQGDKNQHTPGKLEATIVCVSSSQQYYETRYKKRVGGRLDVLQVHLISLGSSSCAKNQVCKRPGAEKNRTT